MKVRSGQKDVFSARLNGNLVVLKIIKDGMLDFPRFQREVDVVSRLNLPYVPFIHESGTRFISDDDFPYIIEQLISGSSIRQILNAQKKIPLRDVVEVIGCLLEASAMFEDFGLVHRDIKPDNIMLDESGKVWILDFGIVRDLSLTSCTSTDAMFGVGTPGYAPPEQFRNQKDKIDSRSDLFSIGVTAFELLHGENPYRAGAANILEIFEKIESLDLPRRHIDGDYDGNFQEFISCMCSRYRSRRPRSAKAAKEWFGEIVRNYSL